MKVEFNNLKEENEMKITKFESEIKSNKIISKQICYNLLGYDVTSECEK